MAISLGKDTINDFWGGLASMLVVLPASIAFGVAIYTPLGEGSIAMGAMAGILGAVALGLIAPIFGGTRGLVTAPCAPAAAVMGALSIDLVHGGMAPERVLILMTLAALIAAALQVLYGTVRGGTLIKYIPYPVVTGYLSGVGLVIFLKQLQPFFGWTKETDTLTGLLDFATWQWPGLIVGLITVAMMMLAPKITKVVPAAILGLAGGIIGYFFMGFFNPALLQIEGNSLLIGELGGQGGSFLDAFTGRWQGLAGFGLQDVVLIIMPALTLSVLLSIDTLKTCVLVDAITHTRHQSNREMVAQGVANMCSAAVGGMPGAGTSGPTLVNIASGGHSRLSGFLEGIFVLIAFLALGSLVAWAPIAALAGILIVVAYRMFDWSVFRLLKQRSTVLDFMVVAIVIGVAVGVGLIQASGVGILLAIILFIREEIRGSVVHRRITGKQISSRQQRVPEQMEILEERGDDILIYELVGNLFFGTTDQLYTKIEKELKKPRRFVILDMRRVRGVDFTAVHVLEQIEARLEQLGAKLAYSNLPRALPTGTDLSEYFDEVGLVTPESHGKVFDQLSDALEWAEDGVLEQEGIVQNDSAHPLHLRDFPFVQGRKAKTIQSIEDIATKHHYEPGETIFEQGADNDSIYFIRRGSVLIELSLPEGGKFHIATFKRGDFFGDMSFIDHEPRSANAIAGKATDLYEITHEKFDVIAKKHPRLAMEFYNDLARALSIRLRHADHEIRALQDA